MNDTILPLIKQLVAGAVTAATLPLLPLDGSRAMNPGVTLGVDSLSATTLGNPITVSGDLDLNDDLNLLSGSLNFSGGSYIQAPGSVLYINTTGGFNADTGGIYSDGIGNLTIQGNLLVSDAITTYSPIACYQELDITSTVDFSVVGLVPFGGNVFQIISYSSNALTLQIGNLGSSISEDGYGDIVLTPNASIAGAVYLNGVNGVLVEGGLAMFGVYPPTAQVPYSVAPADLAAALVAIGIMASA